MDRHCHGLQSIGRHMLDRRRWIQISGIGWLSATLPSAIGPRQIRAGEARSPIKSCILVFFYGGPSQLETFDPKPLATAGVRGEYETISTAVPGIIVGEHLPQLAKIMDRLVLVRSMHHPMRNHNSAAAEVLTGRTPAGGDKELLTDEARAYPTLGSSVSFGLGPRANLLPYVALPYTIYNVVQLPGQTAGLLGSHYDRFQVTGNPNLPEFHVSALEPPQNRPASDLNVRDQLLQQLDAIPLTAQASTMRALRHRALDLVSSDAIRQSFDIAQEDPKVRDLYGRHLLGQSLVLARRLVESGVNFVTVFDGRTNGQNANWDSHEKIFPRHRELIPPADQGLSALIEDLHERGLLDSTLVVAMGEFGRTPKINPNAGRDHWPDCYTVVLAGGGVHGGVVHGASDKIGAYPDRDAVTPADLAATILWRFGIDPVREVHDQTNRPIRLSEGQPLASLFG
jgi:Protein of unknown function (DUF1501)